MESVSHKLDRLTVNPLKKGCRDSTETKTTPSSFNICDYLRYINNRHNEIVDIVNISTNDPDSSST